jgi:hypothetical protein
MNKALLTVLAGLCLVLSACQTPPDPTELPSETASGQLSARRVLGLSTFGRINAEQVHGAILHPKRFAALREGALVLTIQSGLEGPEKPFIAAMSRYCAAIPFSGVPSTLYTLLRLTPEDLNYNYDDLGPGGSNVTGQWSVMSDKGAGGIRTRLDLALRSAAKDSGAETILVVWNTRGARGMPDFRAVVIDVKSGRWEALSPYAKGGALEGKSAPKTEEERAAAFRALADMMFAAQRP